MTRQVLAVGIDPAKQVHHAAAVLYPDRLILDTAFANERNAIVDFDTKVVALAAEHNAQLIYGIEDHRGYGRAVAQALQQAGREIRVVNPLWTHRQKDFYGQDKDDRIDARSVAAVVLRRADKLPDAGDASALSAAIREAERTLDDLGRQRARALNRLHGHLSDVYLASYETFFGELKRPWALRFFARFPLPQDLSGRSVEDLAGILQELAGRYLASARKSLDERARHILAATAALQAQPRDQGLALRAELIRQLCEEILANLERTQRLERLLHHELLPATGQKLESIPGIGTITAATILGEIGDVRRFPNRHAFAKYNGTAPASKSTGGRPRHTARRGCNRRLKRALWLIALTAVRHDPLAKAYYQRRLEGGLSKVDAIKRVARRMSDIIYAMLRTGEAYDRKRLEQAIANRQAARRRPAARPRRTDKTDQPSVKPYRPSTTPA
ncbi:MAG TPA: IS110 family transposase [Bradyrhizobium sp.]|jgi:transposase|nr:IS110 family transposase [Bradyrhizobium sp.]